MMCEELQRRFEAVLSDNGLVEPGDNLLVAVSGGADSVALLHLCLQASENMGFSVIAAHYDHALRHESASDAQFVRTICSKLDVPLVTERCDAAMWASNPGLGIEATARTLRYDFLKRMATLKNCHKIALGHHIQDQAETVLHHVIRGSGLHGLSGMPEQRESFIRPLLTFTVHELRDYLNQLSVDFVEDQSNQDTRYTRNFIRHEVMPLLRQVNPRVDEHISQLSGIMQREDHFWRELIESLDAKATHPGGGWSVDVLVGEHPALRHRWLHKQLQDRSGRQVSFAHVRMVDALISSLRPQAEVDLPGVKVRRRYSRIEISPCEEVIPSPEPVEIPGPGSYSLPWGDRLVVEEVRETPEESPWKVFFPKEKLAYPLRLRFFQPGDRIALPAAAGHKKLKKIFSEMHFEHEARHSFPLLVMGDEILWIPGLRRTGKYQPGDGSEDCTTISLESRDFIERLLVKRGTLC